MNSKCRKGFILAAILANLQLAQYLVKIDQKKSMLWLPFLEVILKFLHMNQSKCPNEDIWWEKVQNFSKANFFSNRSNEWLKLMFCLMSAVDLVGVKIWQTHVKAIGMKMRKLVLGLSLAQILPEEINKILSPNNPGFIDVNRTVY